MEKFTIYLAGDSTVQSYRNQVKPITGWGQVLHTCFEEDAKRENNDGCDWMGFGRKSNSSFEQSIIYETSKVCIDNRAMAGRSSKSYFDEGRLKDIQTAMKKGDYLFIQFAHNDANVQKEERYVTIKEYEEYLLKYVNAARSCGAQPVFVTAIAMRECDEKGAFNVSFPDYRDKMIETGDKYDVAVLDLGKESAEYLNMIGKEKSKELYMWLEAGKYDGYLQGKQDNAHLKEKGAMIYAKLLAKQIQLYDKDDRLDKIKCCLKK